MSGHRHLAGYSGPWLKGRNRAAIPRLLAVQPCEVTNGPFSIQRMRTPNLLRTVVPWRNRGPTFDVRGVGAQRRESCLLEAPPMNFVRRLPHHPLDLKLPFTLCAASNISIFGMDFLGSNLHVSHTPPSLAVSLLFSTYKYFNERITSVNHSRSVITYE